MRTRIVPFLLLFLTPALAAAAPIPVTGLVSGPGGSPVSGARVLLTPSLGLAASARLEMEGKADPDPAATAVTGADGTFRLEAPEAGMWEVEVQAKGMVPQEILLQPLLEETELPPVRLESDAKLEVRVASPDGKPLAGARVQAGEVPGLMGFLRRWRTSNRAALTDAKGMAVLPRSARERLLVRAGVEGQPFAEQEDVRSGSVTLRLAAGTARELRVMDAAGKSPVPGVWARVGESRWVAGKTDADGRFAVPLAARSKVKVFLTAEDGRQLETYAEPPKPPHENEPKGPRVLLLPALEALAGRVVSAADGRPVAGALVWNQEPGAARRTGADGAYRIEVVAGRDAWPQAAAAGYLPADAHLGVPPGMRRGPTLVLEPALAAAGVVVDEQGRPVPGVQVQASPQPAGRMRTSGMMLSGGISRTSASGRFRVSGLVAGLGYELRLSKAGFAVARVEVPPLEPGRPGLGGTDLRIVLRKGRTGFGRVVDRSDQPVAGARVELRPRSGDRRMSMMRLRASDSVKYEAVTDATGRFEVRDLPAGTWELTAHGSGFAPLTVPGLTVPEGIGGTGDVDLGTVVLVPGVGIEGYAVDPEGRPVPGAEIRLTEASADPMSRFLPQEEPLPVATSAQDGFFRVEDRRAGETVDLDASRPGYAPAVASGVQVPPDQPIRLVLQPSSAVEGRTVDPDGKPVAGAQLFIHPTDPVVAGGGVRMFASSRGRQAVSDETGFFRIEDVIPGGFGLQAMATGYQRSELDNLEVRSGQELKGIEVVLAPGAVVEGRVFSPSGQPLAGAEVGVADPTMDFFFGSANTDGDGRFRLEGIAPGTRSVQAEHKSYRRAIKELEVRLGENSVDLRLEGGVEVRGRVVDEGGIPVASARVSLRAGPRSWNLPDAASAADGSFSLDGVADGTYRIMADKEGFARSRDGVEVTVAGSSLSGIEVKLTAGGSIVGQLSGLDFAELSKVQIWGSGRQTGQVSPDGSYRIDHVDPGEHQVTASLPGGSRQAEGRVTLEPGAPEARLDLEFSGGLALTGRVLRNGEAASGLSVMLSGGGLSGRHGDTDHQGRFRFEGIDAGNYELQVYGYRSGSRHREAVDLSADRDVLIELHTVAVSGRVVDAEDQAPIPNAQIILMAAQPDDTAPWQNTETTSDSRGVFRLRDVAEGSWKVRAVVGGYGPAEVDVQVDSNRPVDGLELSLQATEGVVLEVLLPSGRAPDMVHTAVFDAADRVVSRGSFPAGEDGRVRVESVAPGTWDLFLDADGSAAVVVPVTAPGNAGRVILPPAGGLNLKVPGLSEARVGATVKLTDASGKLYRVPWGGQVMKDFDLQGGSRRFEKLTPGQWTLNVSATDGRTWSGSATVVPGGMAEVTLE